MKSGRSPAMFCRRARYASKRCCDSRYTLKQTKSRKGSLRYSVVG